MPIYGEMREWLLTAKELRDEKFPTCPWVFYTHEGERLYWFYKAWATACARAGAPNLLFHDLRRSAVRNMERAGIPRKVAMSISGRKTENIYRRYDIVAERDRSHGSVLHRDEDAVEEAVEFREVGWDGHTFGHTRRFSEPGTKGTCRRTRAESTELKALIRMEVWWALKDLNLRPTDYESAALTAELRARRRFGRFVHLIVQGMLLFFTWRPLAIMLLTMPWLLRRIL